MSKTQIDTQFQNAILTPEEVAAELSLKIETVRDLMRRGILPASKIGGSWRIGANLNEPIYTQNNEPKQYACVCKIF